MYNDTMKSDNNSKSWWLEFLLNSVLRTARVTLCRRFPFPLGFTMGEIMTKEVRDALNDPATRYLLVKAYLQRKSAEPATDSEPPSVVHDEHRRPSKRLKGKASSSRRFRRP
jgi:hypothetical protein